MNSYILNGLINLIYPPNCLICKNNLLDFSYGDRLCPNCFKSISFNFPPFCVKCSRHLNKPLTQIACKTCRKRTQSFDFAWSACLYQGIVKELIHHFKYNNKTMLKTLFLRIITTFIKKYNLDIKQFDIIVPIPLHPAKYRERGYNQAELVARKIANYYNINLNTNILIKRKMTKNQVDLTQKERWTNIKGAFTIKQQNFLKDKNILIIDDLLTTGATSSEAATTLKKAGANLVGILTLAIKI